jgi:ferredoxin-NADP reductase
VRVSAPAGDFFLDKQDSRPLVLLSGGIGLTRILSMLDTIVTQVESGTSGTSMPPCPAAIMR